MIEKKKEILCFYHGYSAALKDVLQHWNENTKLTDVIDFRLTEMLQKITADLKNLKEGK